MRRLVQTLWLLGMTVTAPAVARASSAPIKLSEPIQLENRPPAVREALGAGWVRGLSGVRIKQSATATTWLMYPGACQDRLTGTWSPRTSPAADSLNSYTPSTLGPYSRTEPKLWHIVSDVTPASHRPSILAGSRSLWCGKYDAVWPFPIGYSNLRYDILYVDTGSHLGPNYELTMTMNASTEQTYDFLFLIGGGSGSTDPIGNDRFALDEIIAGGSFGAAEMLVTWTGSITSSTPNAQSINTVPGPVVISDTGGVPETITTTITIDQQHRALYLVFRSDEIYSPEDGLWPHGQGIVLDAISASDTGSIYSDSAPSGGQDIYGGDVLAGTPGSPTLSARLVSTSPGATWTLLQGNNAQTQDVCSPGKNLATDLMFFGGDPASHVLIDKTNSAVVSCTFPIPAGAASILASWDEYMDLPLLAGYVQYCEYRLFRNGSWTDWANTSANGSKRLGGLKAWVSDGDPLAGAADADSVQVRYNLQCPSQACAFGIVPGLLYDNLRLQAVSSASPPLFSIFVGSVAQTTFVDGTMPGLECTPVAGNPSTYCWPGLRGSNLAVISGGIHDNFNSPFGDSITLTIGSGLRPTGMGVNWHAGYDKTIDGGRTIAHTNNAFSAGLDMPRIIYRLYDPATKSWSPLDSAELYADDVRVNGSAVGDTVLMNSEFRMDWPPSDKLAASASLPGGFTINGVGAYSGLAFLPRGTRIQYYFKATDISGNRTYQFQTDAAAYEQHEDLPLLPSGNVRAPDIIEFDVLPRVYPPGTVGWLAAGRTDSPVLNLDGAYTTWSFGYDPVTEALNALGVRADRYRLLQGLNGGGNIGGREMGVYKPSANHFPNMLDYSILDSLASWYRVIIVSTHTRATPVVQEQDARLLLEWAKYSTGTNGGDRCILGTGDGLANALFVPFGNLYAVHLAQDVFGLTSAGDAWSGSFTTQYPAVTDQFAGSSYPVDGGCPLPNRFDYLTKANSTDTRYEVAYPGGFGQNASVSRKGEWETLDRDRSKALIYGYSPQFIRRTGVPTTDPMYTSSGLENRELLLYKFLTGCRGPRTGSPTDTASCWPCPAPALPTNPLANWAAQTGFDTATNGPLYPIQDAVHGAVGVEGPMAGAPPARNSLAQNRPNPFNPETVIPYVTASAGRVVVRVFDISGREVQILVDGRQDPGPHVARWDGSLRGGGQAASGVYFYQIEYPDKSRSSKRMVLVR